MSVLASCQLRPSFSRLFKTLYSDFLPFLFQAPALPYERGEAADVAAGRGDGAAGQREEVPVRRRPREVGPGQGAQKGL